MPRRRVTHYLSFGEGEDGNFMSPDIALSIIFESRLSKASVGLEKSIEDPKAD